MGQPLYLNLVFRTTEIPDSLLRRSNELHIYQNAKAVVPSITESATTFFNVIGEELILNIRRTR
ncbi:hypothetical protein VCR1J2_240163 [Vibrio coralliirubri]|nr:hypothetical protein VCR1J2_240163 [Vibrio coralliirubri]